MPVARKARTADTYNLEARLETLIHFQLTDMEEHPEMYGSKDRLAVITVVGGFLNRKYGWGDGESPQAGSAVRRYSGAFLTKPNVVSKSSRSTRVSGGLAAIADESEDDAA